MKEDNLSSEADRLLVLRTVLDDYMEKHNVDIKQASGLIHKDCVKFYNTFCKENPEATVGDIMLIILTLQEILFKSLGGNENE